MKQKEVEIDYMAHIKDHGGSLTRALAAASVELHVMREMGLA